MDKDNASRAFFSFLKQFFFFGKSNVYGLGMVCS